MAADLKATNVPSTRFREVVLQGPPAWTRGFLAGYLRGSGEAAPLYDAEREGFDCASLRERVRDLFDKDTATLHLLVGEDALPALERAVRAAAEEVPHLRASGSRPLRGARFGFTLRTYSRGHGNRIRPDFEHPPEGASLLPGARFEETLRPEAEGVELLAPAHPYALEGEGTIEGEIPAVLGLYRRYREEELVRLTPLELLDAG